METTKLQYFEKADSPKQIEFIKAQSHCVLCGTVLELTHVVDYALSSVKEEAHCPQCEVRTRAKIFTVH